MKSLPDRLRAFRRLPRHERRLLLEICLLFALVELGLRLCPFHRVLAYVAPAPPASHGAFSSALEPPLPRLVALVEGAARHLPFARTCLKQALVLAWLLRRRGLAVTLRIGVNRETGFKAHAWLEHDGRTVFGDRTPEQYEPLRPVLAGRSR